MNTLLAKWLLALLLIATLMGCASDGRKNKLDMTLLKYANAIRWGEFEQAMNYMEPELREKLRPAGIDAERLKQLKVSRYEETPMVKEDDFTVSQVVRIEVYNVHTQANRSVTDRQVWKYHKKDDTWYLQTGLPNFARSND
jgi:hypothetical protein